MSGLTENEISAVERANAADTRPVIFVHGVGTAADDWAGWRELFDVNGYASVLSEWASGPALVDATLVDTARTTPDSLGSTLIQEVTEHYLELIGQLSFPPVVVGHGFGGLIAQRLASEGVSATTITVASWPIAGVPASTLSGSESAFFTTENIATLDTATVDTRGSGRGPLLLLAGSDDRVTPLAVSAATYELQSENSDVTEYTVIPGRGHLLHRDDGWREVADTALVFAQNYAAPKQH